MSFGEAFDVKRYVVNVIDDLEIAIARIYYWASDTQGVFELLKWMRTYNTKPTMLVMYQINKYNYDVKSKFTFIDVPYWVGFSFF